MRKRRNVFLLIGVGLLLLVGLAALVRWNAQPRTEEALISAVRATFPHFCVGHNLIAMPSTGLSGPMWGSPSLKQGDVIWEVHCVPNPVYTPIIFVSLSTCQVWPSSSLTLEGQYPELFQGKRLLQCPLT
jgi:hypothetical protein